jgi:hypothetical protein
MVALRGSQELVESVRSELGLQRSSTARQTVRPRPAQLTKPPRSTDHTWPQRLPRWTAAARLRSRLTAAAQHLTVLATLLLLLLLLLRKRREWQPRCSRRRWRCALSGARGTRTPGVPPRSGTKMRRLRWATSSRSWSPTPPK